MHVLTNKMSECQASDQARSCLSEVWLEQQGHMLPAWGRSCRILQVCKALAALCFNTQDQWATAIRLSSTRNRRYCTPPEAAVTGGRQAAARQCNLLEHELSLHPFL